MPTLAKEEYFIGGNCDKWHQARHAREIGARVALRWYTDQGIIYPVKAGWWKCHPRKQPIGLDWREKECRAGGGAEQKIGWYRFELDLLPVLRKYGKSFRLKLLDLWLRQIAAADFGMGASSPLGPWTFGITSHIHQPGIYAKRYGEEVIPPIETRKVEDPKD